MSEFTSTQETTTGKSAGPVIGSVIIILILVIGALYFWGAQLNREQNQTPAQVIGANDPTLTALQTQHSGDDLPSISDDLKKTNLDNLDADLKYASQDISQ